MTLEEPTRGGWMPPVLPRPGRVGQTAVWEGRTFRVSDAFRGGPNWVELITHSPDGLIEYDPPIEQRIPSWRVEAVEPPAPILPAPEDPGPQPSAESLVRFTLHAPTTEQGERMSEIRAAYIDLVALIEDKTPESRELSLAITKLEESLFWALGSIVRREEEAS